MKIIARLDKKSIKEAIKTLEKAKEQLLEEMINDLLVSCCEIILRLANEELDNLDMGEEVRRDIQRSWVISEIKNGKITLTNTWHKTHGKWEMAAAYVEFGVGIVGSENPHPEAGNAGYQYNVQSESKDENGTWHFYANAVDLDLPYNSYYIEISFGQGSRLLVGTRGTGATRFLYNAVMNFANKKYAESLWQDIKTKYWS